MAQNCRGVGYKLERLRNVRHSSGASLAKEAGKRLTKQRCGLRCKDTCENLRRQIEDWSAAERGCFVPARCVPFPCFHLTRSCPSCLPRTSSRSRDDRMELTELLPQVHTRWVRESRGERQHYVEMTARSLQTTPGADLHLRRCGRLPVCLELRSPSQFTEKIFVTTAPTCPWQEREVLGYGEGRSSVASAW